MDEAAKERFHSGRAGIIIAADVKTLKELRDLAELAAPVQEVVALKVGFSLGLTHGLSSVVKTVNAVAPIPVIYDHQKAGTDIPQMGKLFAEVLRDAGVHGVIIFPLAGPRTLEGFVSGAIRLDLEPIVGLVMSHPSFLSSEGGYMADDAPERILNTAVGMGVKNFVLPGTKPEILAHFAKGSLSKLNAATIMMPGIGSQGGQMATALEAARPCRSLAIIGSAIYAAPNPEEALSRFVAEVRG